MDQTEEALGYAAEGKKFAEEFTPSDISIKDVGKFVAEMTPIVGDAMAAKEVYDELQKDEPNYYLAGALGGAALVGLIPGIGDVAARAISKGAREVFDVAKRVDVDMNAMGSGLGNVKLKPKSSPPPAPSSPPLKVTAPTEPSLPIPEPEKSVKGYKLFNKGEDGKLYPLFVDADTEVPVGQYLQATFPEYRFTAANGNSYVPSRGTKTVKGAKGTGDMIKIPDQETRDMLISAGFLPKASKAKSIKSVAARPGWHAGDNPTAAHIGPEVKIDGKTHKIRGDNQVWAEVEMPADVDWQEIANSRAIMKKDGTPNIKTAQITDELPIGGHYRYKTNPNMEGNWLISGSMKVLRELDRDEVLKLNKKSGVKDLPTLKELKKNGYYKGGTVMDDYQYAEMMQAPVDQTVQAFALGGDVEEFDPVSGNEIPTGSLPEEVRDDIPAQLSEGEYVVPADVVRFHGVKMFEELRSQAKIGFNSMESNGRIGGEPIGVAVMGDELPFDVSELNMQDDGEPEAPMMNKGGYMTRGYNPGGVVENPVLKSTGGVEYKTYLNAEGKTLLIPFFNGVPMSVIPEGYFLEGTQATTAQSEATATAEANAENARRNQEDKSSERYEIGGDLYNPTPIIKMEELTGAELEKMVADQGSMTSNMVTVGLATINPIMGLFMKLGMANSARQTKNELERRANNSSTPQEEAYYTNLLEIATQEEPGFLEKVLGGIADTFSGATSSVVDATDTKNAYTPDEIAPDTFKFEGITAPEVITVTDLPDVEGARDDPFRDDPIIPNKNMSEEDQYKSYGAGSASLNTGTTPTTTSTTVNNSNSDRDRQDTIDQNKAAARRAANNVDANTKIVVAKAERGLATTDEIAEIKANAEVIKNNLEDASRGMGLRLNKGGLMKKKKK